MENSHNSIKSRKKYSIDLKKFSIFIILIVIAVILIRVIQGISIDSEDNLSKLNSKKHSQELLEKYNRSEMKEVFLNDYDTIQTSIANYIFNNSTVDEGSFSKIYEKINDELKGKNWDIIGMSKNLTWNGFWSINESGILRFKFDIKEIEPSWVNDGDIIGKINLN